MKASKMLPNISCAPSRHSHPVRCSAQPWARHTHPLLEMALTPVLGAGIIENHQGSQTRASFLPMTAR
jgi:hypothetical protein